MSGAISFLWACFAFSAPPPIQQKTNVKTKTEQAIEKLLKENSEKQSQLENFDVTLTIQAGKNQIVEHYVKQGPWIYQSLSSSSNPKTEEVVMEKTASGWVTYRSRGVFKSSNPISFLQRAYGKVFLHPMLLKIAKLKKQGAEDLIEIKDSYHSEIYLFDSKNGFVLSRKNFNKNSELTFSETRKIESLNPQYANDFFENIKAKSLQAQNEMTQKIERKKKLTSLSRWGGRLLPVLLFLIVVMMRPKFSLQVGWILGFGTAGIFGLHFIFSSLTRGYFFMWISKIASPLARLAPSAYTYEGFVFASGLIEFLLNAGIVYVVLRKVFKLKVTSESDGASS